MSYLSSKISTGVLLGLLSGTIVLGVTRAPEIRTCAENGWPDFAFCFGRDVVPPEAVPGFALIALKSAPVLIPKFSPLQQVTAPIPPALIPDTAPGKPLQQGPLLTQKRLPDPIDKVDGGKNTSALTEPILKT